jgi:hypothetical protein
MLYSKTALGVKRKPPQLSIRESRSDEMAGSRQKSRTGIRREVMRRRVGVGPRLTANLALNGKIRRLNDVIMKTLFRTNKYIVLALSLIASVVIISCALNPMASEKAGKVTISDDMIVLHPLVQLSVADEKAMTAVLQKFRKSLYRIDTVENGRVVKTQGTLEMAKLTVAARAASSEGPGPGKSHQTGQITCPKPCNDNTPPINANTATLAEKQKLIARLTPILEKYQ